MTELALEKILWVRPEAIAASGTLPVHAEFFGDHFPRFPVLPGVLALEILKRTAERYFEMSGEPGARLRLRSLRSVKFSNYLKPGDSWESEMKLIAADGPESDWEGRLFHEGRAAVSARMVLGADGG